MTEVREVSSNVLVATDGVICVTAADLDAIQGRAQRNARKRARLCAHPAPTDFLHEMLICLMRDTYVRPHRHSGKSESFHIIEGELDVILFDLDGEVEDVVHMGPYQSGRAFFYRLNESRYHTVLVNTPHVVIHETTNGPFDAVDTEYATWAPDESHAACVNYLTDLRTRIHG